MKKIKDKGISVNERRQYKSGGQEMNFIVQQLVKYGNKKSDAIKMTRKHYNDVLRRYKEPWFVHPTKKAEIISSLSANESVNEANMAHVKTSDIGKKKMRDLVQFIYHVLDLAPNKDFRLTTNGKLLSVNVDKINSKSIQNIKRRYGVDLKESVNEAPGKSGKDQYVGNARVKVEPYTYKNQKRDFHDVSMYRDHKKPYHYYLSIRLAHSNKVDMVVDTGTHIQSKAGKWAQGFIKRRMDGTGKERFN